MLESFILGIVQGIAEWLPVSSEALIVLIKTNFFDGGDLDLLIRQALFLHLGTTLAATIYFRKDIKELLKFKKEDKILKFLVISTIITAVLGYLFLEAISALEDFFVISGDKLMILIGILLLITGIVQLKAKKKDLKDEERLGGGDGLLLGVVQAFAALPGLSRSGSTVAALLIRGYNNATALKLSFLMSIPIVIGGNVLLNYQEFYFSWPNAIGLVTSFVFGLLTIDLLLRLAKKINFAFFVFIFAILSFVAGVI